jgi:hypothetical protein
MPEEYVMSPDHMANETQFVHKTIMLHLATTVVIGAAMVWGRFRFKMKVSDPKKQISSA